MTKAPPNARCDRPALSVQSAGVPSRKARMKTLPRYTITVLVAVAAFLPVFWGAFPQMPLWARVSIGLTLAAVAALVEHRKNVAPHLAIEEKRTYLFGYACDDPFEELRRVARPCTDQRQLVGEERPTFDQLVLGPTSLHPAPPLVVSTYAKAVPRSANSV